MNNNLAIRENQAVAAPTESEFGIMLQQSQMLIKSNFLPKSIQTPEQALAIMLTGRELGIPTMAALNTINVIQQKPTISPQLMLALIERSGQLEDIQIESHADGVTCTMKRRGRSAHSETFGNKEAHAAGLLGKENYKKQPLVMFRWRAVASCARVVFPDVILGLYTPDEMGAEVTTEGEVIEQREAGEDKGGVVIHMPEQKPQELPAATERPMPAEKADYSQEWDEKLSNPTKHPVSMETRARLLAENGHVSRSAAGYVVAEWVESIGTVNYNVTKSGGVIQCECEDFKATQLRCVHIDAVKYHATAAQKQAA